MNDPHRVQNKNDLSYDSGRVQSGNARRGPGMKGYERQAGYDGGMSDPVGVCKGNSRSALGMKKCEYRKPEGNHDPGKLCASGAHGFISIPISTLEILGVTHFRSSVRQIDCCLPTQSRE